MSLDADAAERLRPAQRVASMQPSLVRSLSEGAPADAIPLGLGQPGWAMARPGWDALLGSGPCGYTAHAGMNELRDLVAVHYGAEREQVLITAGAEGALANLTAAWLNPGDRVLVPDPGFLAYPALAQLQGAEPVPYRLDATNRFRLDPDAIVDQLGDHRIKMVVVSLPSNPTGGGSSADALRAVADACRRRGVLLVVDEVYRELYLADERPVGLRDVTDYGVVVGSMSKAWAAPGLRIGWIVGDAHWVHPARVIQGYTVIGPARPSQVAAIALLENSDTILPAARAEIRLRWESLCAALHDHLPNVRATPPDGGFYLWLALPETAHADPMAFCLQLRDEAGVVLIPGLAFGEQGRGHARLSFAANPEQIREGVRRLAPYFA